MTQAIKYICEAIVSIFALLVSPLGWILALILAMPLLGMCEFQKDLKLNTVCIESCAPRSSIYDNGSCDCINKE